MTDTELIKAIHTAVKEETKDLKENLAKEIKKDLKEDLAKEIRITVKEEVKTAVKEELRVTNERLDKIEEKLTKQSNKLSYIDKKFTNKINALDAKFTGIIGKLNVKVDNLQKDVKYLKENPFVIESRLSSLEQEHLELLSLIGKN